MVTFGAIYGLDVQLTLTLTLTPTPTPTLTLTPPYPEPHPSPRCEAARLGRTCSSICASVSTP